MRWKTSLGDFVGISEQECSLEEIVKIKEYFFEERNEKKKVSTSTNHCEIEQ